MVDSLALASPARRSHRESRRTALLEAAVAMFNERGFHATLLDDVAARLGVTKPVIYHHLGNKDQVLFECLAIGLGRLREASAEARAAPGSGLDRLRLYLTRYAETIMDDFGRCVIRTAEETLAPASQARIRAMKREIDATMRAMIEDAAADGSARVADVRLTAFTLAGALNWPARWYREDGEASAGRLAVEMVDMLCAGVATREEAA